MPYLKLTRGAKRRLTIEVWTAQKMVAQICGKANRRPDEEERLDGEFYRGKDPPVLDIIQL